MNAFNYIIKTAYFSAPQSYTYTPHLETTFFQNCMTNDVRERMYMYDTMRSMGNSTKSAAYMLLWTYYTRIKPYMQFEFRKHKHIIANEIAGGIMVSVDAAYEFRMFVAKIQRTYFAFGRLARLFRLKRATVQTETDLYLAKIEPDHKRTFLLLQKSHIYYFSVSDIVQMLVVALTHAHYMFSTPKSARNPYNNTEFTKSDLYNMYFKLKWTLQTVPPLIELFFRANFNIYAFKKNHEGKLIEHIVCNYLKNTAPEMLYGDCMEMLNVHCNYITLHLHPEFSKKVLVDTFRPYLLLYFRSKYVPDRMISQNCNCELRAKLTWFGQNYPFFGQEIQFIETLDFHGAPENHSVRREDNLYFMDTHVYNEPRYMHYILHDDYLVDVDTDTPAMGVDDAVFVFRDDDAESEWSDDSVPELERDDTSSDEEDDVDEQEDDPDA